MLPKISGYGLSSESKLYVLCPHCKQSNEIGVARFVVAVSRSESFVCVACEGKFEVAVLPQPAGNLTQRAADGLPPSDHEHFFHPDKRGVMRCVVCNARR